MPCLGCACEQAIIHLLLLLIPPLPYHPQITASVRSPYPYFFSQSHDRASRAIYVHVDIDNHNYSHMHYTTRTKPTPSPSYTFGASPYSILVSPTPRALKRHVGHSFLVRLISCHCETREGVSVSRTHAISSSPLMFPPCDSSAQPYLLSTATCAARHLHPSHSSPSTFTHLPIQPQQNPQFFIVTSHRQVQLPLTSDSDSTPPITRINFPPALRSAERKARPSLPIP